MADLALRWEPDRATPDWAALARRSRRRGVLRSAVLAGFLTLVSIPVVLPYLWMLVLSLTARTGDVRTEALWAACAVLAPATAALGLAAATMRGRRRRLAVAGVAAATATALAAAIGDDLHMENYRFFWTANLVGLDETTAARGQFPSIWAAFVNSLLVASASTLLKVVTATLAGYYLARFTFPGRSTYLQGLLVIEVFHPWMLVIPIFLVVFWVGLLNTLGGPILVLTALQLPFFIFVMKGFFDAVPWEIEMSALTDGASRLQAFRAVVLPQVRGGIVAITVLGFIAGWEEYVFVNALRTGDSYWVMSTFLYYVADDVMGVDYGLVAAVACFYVTPSLVLYLLTQRHLTQMTLGGVKG